MNSVVSLVIAGWLIASLCIFQLIRYVGKKASEEDPKFFDKAENRFILTTELGFISLLVTCVILWPIILVAVIWKFILITGEYFVLKLSIWNKRRKTRRSIKRLLSVVDNITDEENKQRLMGILGLLQEALRRKDAESEEES
jgi:hypothetical protein